jgi:hypothetical protein
MTTEPKLQIKIDNKSDIELFEFSDSMPSFSNEYYRFLNIKKKVKSETTINYM